MARKKIVHHTEDGSDCGCTNGPRVDWEVREAGMLFIAVSIRLVRRMLYWGTSQSVRRLQIWMRSNYKLKLADDFLLLGKKKGTVLQGTRIIG
jgi:hypothetical protein